METRERSFWQDFKACFLKGRGDSPLCRLWLESVVLSKAEKKGPVRLFALQAPSDLHKKWLEENLLKDFCRSAQRFYKEFCQVRLEVAPRLPLSKQPINERPSSFSKQSLFFNPKYVFESFIVGKNSKLAYGASQAVTKRKTSEDSLNPLFIYGPSGLGKTHLLNAIGQEALKNRPNARVVYLSAERFLNEYISALQNKQMGLFRKKFRKNCDLLLIDDIQIIAKGRGIQEEFFHTFNDLYSRKAQVVACCDQSPGEVSQLEERIKTRLEGGLMADISYPDRETRLAILKSKTEEKGLFLSAESLELIAQACRRSIREMEGVLNKIKIMTELHGGSLSFKEIERILQSVQKELTAEEIQKRAARAFKISIESLKSASRKKTIVRARQTAMFLIRSNLKKSLNDISRTFGKKDHTTVLNSIKQVERLRREDKEFKRLLEALQREIHSEF